MHGRVKVKTTLQQEEEKRKEREEKAKLFSAGSLRAFDKRSKGQLDDESFAITSQLLAANPDFYTLWNFRREIILHKKSLLIDCYVDDHLSNETKDQQSINDQMKCEENDGENDEKKADEKIDEKLDERQEKRNEFQKLCDDELLFTANCLIKNPKSYCAWHQRSWIIKQMPEPNLQKEIKLCGDFLEMDERNFHCWDHRRFVCKLANTSVEDELKFTLDKIQQNFSNFSSWYYRSCLLTYAVDKNNYDFSQHWKDEYKLVENALFTDPADQSPWFYHKWLVSTNYGRNTIPSALSDSNESVRIERIVYHSDYSRLILLLSRPIKNSPLVSVKTNGSYSTEICWISPTTDFISNVWFCSIPKTSDKLSTLSIHPCPTFVRNPDCIEPVDLVIEENVNEDIVLWERKIGIIDVHSVMLQDSYLESLRCLHELEPNNKWINLALSKFDPNHSNNTDIFDTLIEMDPLRINYYNDQKSKMIMKNKLDHIKANTITSLESLNFTKLYYIEKLTHIQFLNLSQNRLNKISKNFNKLLSLEVLIMDNNQIYTIEKCFNLDKLKVLSLSNNRIKNIECLNHLRNCCQLNKLYLTGNPLTRNLNASSLTQLSLPQTLIITDGVLVADENQDIFKHLNIVYKLF